MAKAKVENPRIVCPYFKGYLKDMPQEAKNKMQAEKPEAHKMIFVEEKEPEIQTIKK